MDAEKLELLKELLKDPEIKQAISEQTQSDEASKFRPSWTKDIKTEVLETKLSPEEEKRHKEMKKAYVEDESRGSRRPKSSLTSLACTSCGKKFMLGASATSGRAFICDKCILDGR